MNEQIADMLGKIEEIVIEHYNNEACPKSFEF